MVTIVLCSSLSTIDNLLSHAPLSYCCYACQTFHSQTAHTQFKMITMADLLSIGSLFRTEVDKSRLLDSSLKPFILSTEMTTIAGRIYQP